MYYVVNILTYCIESFDRKTIAFLRVKSTILNKPHGINYFIYFGATNNYVFNSN